MKIKLILMFASLCLASAGAQGETGYQNGIIRGDHGDYRIVKDSLGRNVKVKTQKEAIRICKDRGMVLASARTFADLANRLGGAPKPMTNSEYSNWLESVPSDSSYSGPEYDLFRLKDPEQRKASFAFSSFGYVAPKDFMNSVFWTSSSKDVNEHWPVFFVGYDALFSWLNQPGELGNCEILCVPIAK